MELEFDKEIDAILRKARGGGGVALKATASPHLDADTIAAFAENALPQKAKLLYTEHFADCDRCRRLLSQTVLFNSEAMATVASTSALASTAVTAVPWYQSLFKTPNLALAMGALVIAFSGILGYLVLQNRNAESNASVSQVTGNEPKLGGPYFGGDVASNMAANSTTAANTAANTMAPAANTAPMVANSAAANAPGTLVGRVDSGRSMAAGKSANACPDCGSPADEALNEVSKPAAVTAPPPVSVDITGGSPVEKKAERAESDKFKDGDDAVMAKRKQAGEDRYRRDLPASPSKSGPARSGPIMNQTQSQTNNIYDMPVKRTVGGKTFENKNGAWYDSAYRGQATTNYRRGTDEYKKLDGGLRNIADTVGGTVVLVWKSKAYRVQ